MPQRRHIPWTVDLVFRQNVAMNIDGVVKRAETMACKTEREQVRNSEHVADSLISFPTLGASKQRFHPCGGSGYSHCDKLDIKCNEPTAACKDGRIISTMVLSLIILFCSFLHLMHCKILLIFRSPIYRYILSYHALHAYCTRVSDVIVFYKGSRRVALAFQCFSDFW